MLILTMERNNTDFVTVSNPIKYCLCHMINIFTFFVPLNHSVNEPLSFIAQS